MSKKKKNQPRPRWYCPKCKMSWVNCEPVCIICKIPGTPLNEGAEKILNKRGGTT
jgi:hypothetical protein